MNLLFGALLAASLQPLCLRMGEIICRMRYMHVRVGHIWPNIGHMGIWAYVKKIWSSGVSSKKASRMQPRDVDLRSVGHSGQKLWPKLICASIFPCILHCEPKKISNIVSGPFSDLAQKAKLSKMVK